MSRVKRAVSHVKKRRTLRKLAKGYKWGRKNTIRLAKTAVKKAGQHAYVDRKRKKRVNRALWLVKLNAAVREHGLSYSKFIAGLKKNKIELDRKVLAELAEKNPKVFAKIVEKVK
ncbi:50S ribosomal protein L20 [Candidatus Falkowbacteria bacterium]|nr:50S ribosomal protein L20 [Candidatus Falkowbacteria bacterium]